MRRNSIRFETRLAIATTVLTAIVCLGLSWLLVRSALADLKGRLEHHGRAVLEALALDAPTVLQRGDLDALAELAETTRLRGDVAGIRIFDTRGLLLASTGTVISTGSVPPVDAVSGDPVNVGHRAFELWAVVPALARGEAPLGLVNVTVSLRPLVEFRNGTLMTAAILTVLFMVIGAVGATTMARAMTRPLSMLARAANDIAAGNLDLRVDVRGADELGTLARAFNLMVESVARSRASLEDTIRELERANHLKSEFVATVSHELRTPLNVILGNVEILAEAAEQLAPQHRALLAAIRRYALLQLDLVTSVLDFEHLSSAEMGVRIERFDVDAVLADVSALQEGRLASGVRLRVVVAPDCPTTLETDRVKLHQILRNLLDNAVKFTSTGLISAEAHSASVPDRIVFTVTDTGEGVAEEELPRIFNPFYQLGASSTRRTNGVGLGLSIVHRLVQVLGGTISVTSRVGRGSTFRVELPVRRVDPCTPASMDARNEAA